MVKLNLPPEGAPPALSRTALEEFIKCPRCFYLHRRKGLKQLSRIPLTLSVATDALLKNEFDAVRASGQAHPIWEREGLDVRAYVHPDLESGFGQGYKRQMEIYQWLFRSAGFRVSSIGYFLYVDGDKPGGFYDAGGGRICFEPTLIAYEGDTGWFDDCIAQAVACYKGDELPTSGADCDTCRYVSEHSTVCNGKG